jgi:hypothetical protein
VWTSSDGISWAERNFSSGADTLRGVHYGNGYIAAGDSRLMYKSANALTWTSITAPYPSGNCQYGSLTGGNNYLAIIADNDPTKLYYTNDGGTNWSNTPTTNLGQTNNGGHPGTHYSPYLNTWFLVNNPASGNKATKTTATPPTSGWTGVTVARAPFQPMNIMSTPSRGPYVFQNGSGPSQFYNGTSFVSIGTANVTGGAGSVVDSAGGGAVIVIGQGGGAFSYSTSYTPSTYSSVTAGTQVHWGVTSQESGSPKWVSVGGASEIFTSDNGSNWTQRSAPRASQTMWQVRKI